MKQRLLLLIALLPGILTAQQKVIFPDDFNENMDGMEVTVTNPLLITSTRSLSTNGVLTLAAERIKSATEEHNPGKEMYTQWQKELPGRLLFLRADKAANYRTGQQTLNLTGTISVHNGTYTITPKIVPSFTGNERTDYPKEVTIPYNLKVASFNLNFYISNPTLWNPDYGAANQSEFTRQRTKILSALKAMDADIYALCEVGEGQTAVQDLVNGLNEMSGTNTYFYIDSEDTRESTYTKNTFIYNTTKVEPYKNFRTIGSYLKLRHVAQAFNLKENKERLIISLNHFKSKSSGNGSNADQYDGQSKSNEQRKSEAYTLVNQLNTLTNYYDDPDILILGDLNSYSKEDPIRILTNASLVNMLEYFAPQDYSYVYDGAIGYLDHSIATVSMSKQVTDAFPWHINADEQSKFGYKNEAHYSPNPYRCSDHDPIITTLMLSQTTGITNPENCQNRVQIYGNPHDGYLTLKGERINKVEVFNIDGKILFTDTASTTGDYFILSTDRLTSGFYLIRIYSEEHYSMHKIIIP